MQWDRHIIELLERSGLSLRAFASKIGVSYETVRRWLPVHAQEPVLSIAVAVADATGWPVDGLVSQLEPLVGPVRVEPTAWVRNSTGFAASLIAIATARCVPYRKIAEDALVPSSTLVRWTNGRVEPGIYHAKRVADALGETLFAMAAGPEHCRTLEREKAA